MADPVSASASNSFTITIDDSSPSVLYSPLASSPATPDLSAGWNSIFDGASGQSGQGATLHATAADGASVSLRWNGTGIVLYGNFTPSPFAPNANGLATYSMTLDGIPTTNFAFSSASINISDNVLAAFTNLSYAEHVVALAVHNPELLDDGAVLLQFDRADLVSEPPPATVITKHPSLNSSSNTITQVVPDDAISFQGQWSFQPTLLPGMNIAFHTSNKVGDRASLAFNGTAITISGLPTLVSGSYNVSIDDEVPLTLSARSSINISAPTVLYYRTGLDPSIMHHISVVNAGAIDDTTGNFLALASASVTTVEPSGVSPSPTNMSTGLPHGTVAAIAVCASITFVVLLIVVGVYIHRRRSSSQRKQGFIQNPRLNRLRRFSFMSRTARSQHDDLEKDRHGFIEERPRRSQVGVVDITGKSAEDMDDEDEEGRDLNASSIRREGRVASQNSDGSFAIDLPRPPDPGYVRASEAESPTPPRDSSSISPIVFRTSRPRGPRDMRSSLTGHVREGSRGILLSDVGRSDQDPSALPQIEGVSPLRVNFQDVSETEAPFRHEERHISAGGTSIPPSLKLALFGHNPTPTDTPITPTTPNGGPHVSFLDMESSRSTSIKSSARSARQSAAESIISSSKSRAEYANTDYALLPPDNRKSLALSMNIGGGPTSSRPSLSPSISLQPIPLPPLPSQRPALGIPEDALTSSDRGERRVLDAMPSPTDSLPLTVSDIHFRHSSYSTVSQPSDSRRASAANRSSSSQRPPHPPLPVAPEHKPFIVQKLLGLHGSTPATPYSSPITPAFNVSGPSTGRVGSTHVASPMSPGFSFIPRDSTGRTK